jgi:hypothetical protein
VLVVVHRSVIPKCSAQEAAERSRSVTVNATWLSGTAGMIASAALESRLPLGRRTVSPSSLSREPTMRVEALEQYGRSYQHPYHMW